MKKTHKSFVLLFAIAFSVLLNGCDIFEKFLFNLPIYFEITSVGTSNPSGAEFYCLTDNETYMDYKDKLNSIVFVEAHVVTKSVSPTTITGNATLRLFAGTNSTGLLLASHTATNISPANFLSPNSYKLEFTNEQIAAINNALKDGVTCLYGDYTVAVASGGALPPAQNNITVRIDVLFQVDADL